MPTSNADLLSRLNQNDFENLDIMSFDRNSNYITRGQKYEIQDPEIRQKPEINEVSKLLAQTKRTGQPIHERLYKQEILSHKIANELLGEEEKRLRV